MVYRKIRNNLTNFPLWCVRRTTRLFLSGAKSSFQVKPNFASHLETKIPKSEGRAERLQNPKLLEVQFEFSTSGDGFRSRRVIWLPLAALTTVESLFWSGQQTALTQTTQWRIYEVLSRGDTGPLLKQQEPSELWANSC